MNQKQGTLEVIQDLMNEVRKAETAGKNDLVILGGAFDQSQFASFLDIWKDAMSKHMPWRIYEYVSQLEVHQASTTDPALPGPEEALERGRFFGPGGDLDLRRDGQVFSWRFIGKRSEDWPAMMPGEFPFKNYWDEHPELSDPFRVFEVHTVQWRPNEDRVHGNWLEYTGLAPSNVRLNQRHFQQNGRLEFVWFTGLEVYEP